MARDQLFTPDAGLGIPKGKSNIDRFDEGVAGVANTLVTVGAKRDENALRRFLQGNAQAHDLDKQARQQEFDQGKFDDELDRRQDEFGQTLQQNQSQSSETGRHNRATEADASEKRKYEMLKTLMNPTAADGKPLGAEMQKSSNLLDTARSQLNSTEKLALDNPGAAMLEKVTPGFISNLVGGKLKEIKNSGDSTREAMQNAYTGAAANGLQVPSFQGFSGPGIGDILNKDMSSSGNVRDAINSLQKGYEKQTKGMDPEMLRAAGLEDDPMVQVAMKGQTARADAKQQQFLQSMDPQDQEAYKYLQANPNDPHAAAIKVKLTRRYGAKL